MPELSRFYGLEISFRFSDHLPPHIHVKHEGEMSLVLIDTVKEIWETKKAIAIEPLK